jgi:hypothetical protein
MEEDEDISDDYRFVGGQDITEDAHN